MITRKVTPSESGKRLHRYLRILMPNIPLGQIYKMIDQGRVRINGKRKKQDYELNAGDELAIHIEEAAYQEASVGQKKLKFIGVSADIDVVHEDSELLVVNKPVGMLTHPDQAQSRDTLIGRVHAYLYRNDQLDSALFQPATANRLDRNTSGLVLIGKTAGMLHQLNQWIQKRELEKYYMTLVEGRLSGEGTIEGSLVRDEKSNRTLVVASRKREDAEEERPGEKEATTRYHALQTGRTHSLVEIELISGRTHQIRTHLQSIGHPLLGDIKYGGHAMGTINHQLLHAWRMVMPDGREFNAPLPLLFRQTLDRLGLQLN
ncbi:MAG: RluA family pseudouridine synthase [Cohnella sp.]|nr:RluA family pseudouridine synthase [Cohnella sp.]